MPLRTIEIKNGKHTGELGVVIDTTEGVDKVLTLEGDVHFYKYGYELNEHRHVWRNSKEFFVGWLYPSIYPWYCRCGAFRKEDGTIIEPQSVKKEEPPNA